MNVTRHFVTIAQGRFGARQVHYRRAGQGPALLMLHQSPLSSRDMLPAMQRLSPRFTLIAPDTPGYGCSDPFGREDVTMEQVADGVVELLDALGIEQVAVYGFHTGAMIAGALAAGHPARLSCAVANGYVVMDERSRADILEHYLPRFEPRWDGSHLAWLWARLREQKIFFPWYRASAATRLGIDMPTPDTLQDAALEFLRAGDEYRIGYRAALSFDSEHALREVTVPLLVTAAEHDPLHAGLQRLQAARLPGCVEVRSGGGPEATLDLAQSFLLRHPAPLPPAAPRARALAGRCWSEMVPVPGGQLRVRRNLDAAGRTVLVQHDAAGASDTVEPLARSLIGQRPVLAIDLPGQGESDATIGTGDVSIVRQADALLQVLDALELDRVDVFGLWGGGLAGLELATRTPTRVARLVISGLPDPDPAMRERLRAEGAPAIEPDWYGGHLLLCWHLVRDQGLFRPWFERKRVNATPGEPQVDPRTVHGRVVNVLKAPVMWRLACEAQLDFPTRDRLAGLGVPTLLCATDWDPQRAETLLAARRDPRLAFMALPDDMAAWGPALLPFLNR